MWTEMRERSCPVCGNRDPSRVFAEANFDPAKLDAFAFASRKLPEYMHHRLVECLTCDTLYSSPVPDGEGLAGAYRDAAFDSGKEAAYAGRTYASVLRSLSPQLPDQAGALDVGTGDGAFLEHLIDAGFTDVAGVEPSTAPVAAAKPHIRPLIRADVFRASDFMPGSMSLVTCFQTIEHVPDPAALCRDALQLLKPGGALLLIGHNRRAASAKLMGRKSPIFDIEHLQLFSPPSMRALLERAGYDRVRVKPLVNRYPASYWTKLFPAPLRLKRAILAAMRVSRLGNVVIPLPAGNLVAVGFRPSS
jgi:SAM-dependent methyltransferase